MKDFRELKVWQKGMALFDGVVKDSGAFPKTEVGVEFQVYSPPQYQFYSPLFLG